MSKSTQKVSRRGFLGTAGATVAAFNIVPSHVLFAQEGEAPNDKLNIAFIGAGGRAGANIGGCAGQKQNIYALCDVDENRCAGAVKKYPEAKVYTDWREMLDKEAKNIDAVVVSTPDHTHAIASISAMQLGKHVYCEKPLSRTVSEARLMKETARKYGVCTQMGNQGHAAEGARLTNEWIQAGAIGEVREVHTWTNRPIWPQGIVRPPEEPVPETMNWDVWLGTAPEKPYSGQIAPFKWRGYWDYGAGALGDMGAHIIDHPVWALDLRDPLSVEVEFERKDPKSAADTFPVTTKVTYEFAARGDLPPVKMIWFDGKQQPPRPEMLEEKRKLGHSGVIYYGSKHVMMHGSHGGAPRILPEEAMKTFERPEKTFPRSDGGHYGEWIKAIKANDPSKAISNFDYAAFLTEVMLLGCVATQVGSGTKLTWNPKEMKTGNDVADRYLHHEWRKGWSV